MKKIDPGNVILGLCVVWMILAFILNVTAMKENFEQLDPAPICKSLTDLKWVFYGRESCGWCKKQKDVLGEGMKHIKYVGCDQNPEQCQAKNINGVPHWENEATGEVMKGFQSLESLAKKI